MFVSAVLALLALIALRNRYPGAITLVWLCIIVGTLDTVHAIIQSVRDSVFTYALGVNWVIVSIYVPALLVSICSFSCNCSVPIVSQGRRRK
jgi:hypothetical protein